MSYTPGTKLSYANGSECATVLTNDMVMATMVQGAPWRERMPLADWLILAEGQETVVPSDSEAIWTAAIKKGEMIQAEAAAWANVSHAGAMWAAARERMDAETATTTYPEHPVGTKLKWTDNDASSTVIVTKKGLLEVKRSPVTNGRPMTMYASELAWRTTLPSYIASNPVFTITPPKPTLIQEKLAPLPEGLTDIERIEELSRRFNYKPLFLLLQSQKMRVVSYDKSIEEFKEKLALASGDKALQIASGIIQITRYADEARAKLDGMTEEQQNAQPMGVYQGRTPCAIHVEINGVKELIGSYTAHNGKYLAYNGGLQYATTFAELGLGENPALSVVYRKKTYVIG